MPARAVLLLSLAAFASAAALRGTDPLLPLIAAQFGTTPGGASAVITGFAVAYGLLQLVNGPIADRIGKYRMVFWVTAISALGNLACALAPSLGTLVAARFATGATVGAIVPLAMAWIGDAVPYEKRQPVLARFLIGHMLGVAFATAAAGLLGERLGWRAMFWLLTALYAGVALLLYLELRGNPQTHARTGQRTSLAEAFRRMAMLIHLRWVRVVLATVCIEGGLFYGALAFVALDLHLRHDLSLGAAGSMVAAFSLGALAYGTSAGPVVARLGERGLVLGGGLLIALGFVGLAAAPAPGWALPCLVALGAGIYMFHNTLQVHATQMAPEARGGALALFACSLFTGQSAGVWLASIVVDASGARPVFAAAAAGLFLLALDFRRRLARLRRRE
ncbi:MAG: MFS transporter [Betaproteobacteria bacterium]|nr:MFS transporter [Betaproteobacteria bacterium]MDH5220298.1 MFS transporter [Betaproteobacteria bacterium]MDH5351115.1 MFS transporter [Betaproteobacteria bacterium]